MSITKDDIKHIAALARIGLKKDEIVKYQKELSAVLDYFKMLEKLPTDKIEPIGHITGVDNIFADDRIKSSNEERKHKLILKNIPQMKNNQVKVRSVL
ncbi:MAG TPA: Asp-tRNA(Asn)/Glu-tRNA(Gln) amidotransferase subunit GatC [Candidatus Moranbacteria bacterium]|nr:Asp-tRNA(Asn)/Glu-tRNA(Gln) amidotransferase subunit GatC [Candidatus Moranbacteria bacterium]